MAQPAAIPTLEHEWLTPAEAAAKLRVSRGQLIDLIHRGALVYGVHFTKPVGLGRRFRTIQLDAYMNCTNEDRQPPPTNGGKVNLHSVP